MKKINLSITLLLLLYSGLGSLAQSTTTTDSILLKDINDFIEEWHYNAAMADTAYFNKISDSGIYIGTDPTEHWTKSEFVIWSHKYFERGKAWSFTTIDRNIYLSEDKRLAWFDELVNTGMGVCRASGVIQNYDTTFKILHYHLSIAVPNDDIEEIKKIIGK